MISAIVSALPTMKQNVKHILTLYLQGPVPTIELKLYNRNRNTIQG
jgi:hypothetical protein